MKQQLLQGIENSALAKFTVLLSSLLQAKKQAGNDQTFSLNELADHASKFVTFSDNDRSSDAVLSEAEANARAYTEARNRNSQPANLSGFDQNLVKSVHEWVAKKQNHLRGGKKT
jgi:hypothetical protein